MGHHRCIFEGDLLNEIAVNATVHIQEQIRDKQEHFLKTLTAEQRNVFNEIDDLIVVEMSQIQIATAQQLCGCGNGCKNSDLKADR